VSEAALKISTFNPNAIPYQREVIDLVRHEYDYSTGNLEILLSGGFGSGKSQLMAHLALTHALLYPKSQVCIARRAMPDLKKTIWREILDHIGDDLIEGRDFTLNKSEMSITLCNGSRIFAASWADKRYAKFRSLKISALFFEELTENDEEDMEAFKQLKSRLRRVPGITENLLVAASNPDSPSHWAYKYFIEPNMNGSKHANRFVFFSKTSDNPFLDPAYIAQLSRDLTPKEKERFIDSLWIDLVGETIYDGYNSEQQYLKTTAYDIRPELPVGLTWDFNIGDGKPMSCAVFQYDPVADEFSFFREVVLYSSRTADTLDELDALDLFDKSYNFEIYGDAAGKNRDTRSLRSDYEIIRKYLDNKNVAYTYHVPPSNPPVRTRHNTVNAYCLNAEGRRRLKVYQGCVTLDEGFRLTKLKKGGNYIEDDSKHYQHITTAVGYAIVAISKQRIRSPSGTRMR